MEHTEQIRRRVLTRKATSLRLLAAEIGISFVVLGRFLNGGDVSTKNLDRIVAWLEKSA